MAPATKGGMHFLARRAVVWFSDGRKPGCPVFAAKGGIKNAPERAPTSPAGTVSQPIGKPFNGQAKGLLWLTWRSYAGPPQYFIPPEGGALNPSGRRQPVPDRTLGAQGRQARRRHQPSRQKTTVGRLNGRPFYGQAKGLLRPTCTSYAGCAHQPSGIQRSTESLTKAHHLK